MGANTSNLRDEEIDQLHESTHFSRTEIKRLYLRFKQLDKLNLGLVTTDDFLSIPEMVMNPLVMRVIALFDDDGNDEVNFKQFITTLSVFHPKASEREKLEFAFKVYDVDGDGYISVTELTQTLFLMAGNSLTEKQLNLIANETIRATDSSGKGSISFDEFEKALTGSGVVPKMSIQF
eukprot:TRINITY_DN14557_c0_g1_i1.p1 TRINITY_DN14557_c0_g1~~TRINITY_DN14557_c0_g1_i1.p1  ORF type:complete len:206 (+),score=85.15 TRINITY_DN14557_c0_g1_i1:86-619(+)